MRTVCDLDTVYKNVFHFFLNGAEYFVDASNYFENEDMEFVNGTCLKIHVNPNEVLQKNVTSTLYKFMGIFGLICGIATLILFIAFFMNGMFDSFL